MCRTDKVFVASRISCPRLRGLMDTISFGLVLCVVAFAVTLPLAFAPPFYSNKNVVQGSSVHQLVIRVDDTWYNSSTTVVVRSTRSRCLQYSYSVVLLPCIVVVVVVGGAMLAISILDLLAASVYVLRAAVQAAAVNSSAHVRRQYTSSVTSMCNRCKSLQEGLMITDFRKQKTKNSTSTSTNSYHSSKFEVVGYFAIISRGGGKASYHIMVLLCCRTYDTTLLTGSTATVVKVVQE